MRTNDNRSMTLTDVVLATFECNGRQLATLNSAGFVSLDQVVRHLSGQVGRFAGLARVTVRNKSQGWMTCVPLACSTRRRSLPISA